MIKCFYCERTIRVCQIGNKAWLEAHGLCRGSGAPVRGNWRDDPTYCAVDFRERIATLMQAGEPSNDLKG